MFSPPPYSDPPSSTADRTLKLVTKTIQNLANLVEFKAKESFMIYLNSFIKDHMPLMTRFVDKISVSFFLWMGGGVYLPVAVVTIDVGGAS